MGSDALRVVAGGDGDRLLVPRAGEAKRGARKAPFARLEAEAQAHSSVLLRIVAAIRSSVGDLSKRSLMRREKCAWSTKPHR